MIRPFFTMPSLANSGSFLTNPLTLIRARTVSLTLQFVAPGSSSGNVTVTSHFSPDGRNYDSVALETQTIAITASSVVQGSLMFAVPEHGYVVFKIANGDTTYAMANLIMWVTIQSWSDPTEVHAVKDLRV